MKREIMQHVECCNIDGVTVADTHFKRKEKQSSVLYVRLHCIFSLSILYIYLYMDIQKTILDGLLNLSYKHITIMRKTR